MEKLLHTSKSTVATALNVAICDHDLETLFPENRHSRELPDWLSTLLVATGTKSCLAMSYNYVKKIEGERERERERRAHGMQR
ncbi:unnamed protein product [Pylaiella littoralis]